MRKWIIASCLALAAGLPLAAQRAGETPAEKAARMEWFDRAKLGIFIHWGIYAVDGVSESWSFYNNYLPYSEYLAQKDGFTASRYDPAGWAKLIQESGAQYTVITSKHHDGVALWDTRASDLSIPKQAAAKRDVLTPFVKEVRKRGLKLGLYYSLLDWSHPDYPNFTKTETRYAIADDPARWQRFIDFDKAQLTELSKAYKPDLFWFDGDWEQSAETRHAPEIIDLLASHNRKVIVNSRIQGYGDYGTPEQGVPTVRPEDRYWARISRPPRWSSRPSWTACPWAETFSWTSVPGKTGPFPRKRLPSSGNWADGPASTRRPSMAPVPASPPGMSTATPP